MAATTLAVLGAYELVSRLNTSILPESLFPPTTRIVSAGFSEIQTGRFWDSIGGTLEGWAIGLGVATFIAVPLGIALGSRSWAWRATRVLADILRPLPSVALLPLLIVLIGFGLELKVWIVAFGAFWPLFIQAVYGVQDVEAVAWDMARAYRLKPLDRFRYLIVPTALPYIGTGLRISAIVALNVCISEELIVGTQTALGTSIALAENSNQYPLMYVFIATSGIIGLLINVGFRRFEHHLLFWHPSVRGEVIA
jgi:ABC-type nitrate/sulfonate/bicarbonate transport system permease component